MSFKVLPYKVGSRSAKALATALNGKVLRLEGGSYRARTQDTIINWGRSDEGVHPAFERGVLGLYKANILNAPCDVAQMSNKLKFFQEMQFHGLSDLVPKFWTNQEDIEDEYFPVVARTILSGHSGAGIVICGSRSDLVPAPLYTQYLKKKDEYRVHCGKTPDPVSGELQGPSSVCTISVQRKARRQGHENPNWQVRNHSNGFNYVRGGVAPPDAVLDVAKTCFAASGLDFGAVDVIWNEHSSRSFVLEINTAPGLEGQTVTDYANYFKGVI